MLLVHLEVDLDATAVYDPTRVDAQVNVMRRNLQLSTQGALGVLGIEPVDLTCGPNLRPNGRSWVS